MTRQDSSLPVLPMLAALMVGALMGLLMLLTPLFVAADIRNQHVWTLAFFGLLYVVYWLFAIVLVVDAAAYLYGTRRPYFAYRRPVRLVLGEAGPESGSGFALTSLVSYALTLHGFAATYLLLSQVETNAFSVQLSVIDALYYTLGNAVTAGAGEITARSQWARALTAIEYVVTMLYNIFILAGIVGFAARSGRARNAGDP